MATESKTSAVVNQFTAPLPASLVHNPTPANRLYVFAKRCTNDHGRFAKGDKARGAFSEALVASYLALGILVPVASPDAEQGASGG